jgi:DNA recombination protein RmuC
MVIETAVLIVLVMISLTVGWRLRRLERRFADPPAAGLQLLQQEVQAVRSGVDARLREHWQQTHELSQRIGRLQKATEQVEQLGLGLDELQKILQPPQLRGAFGERFLEDALADVLPRDRFRLQYTYPSTGVRVDAAVLLSDGRLLPIDSKFPLENFRRFLDLRQSGDAEADAARRAFARDVRRHVDDVASKYLSPEDGALDVAFMYIPSESVFHEVLVGMHERDGAGLSDYALRRRVVPVSPNTLYAYLSVVRIGMRGFQLQESAREILTLLMHLSSDVEDMRSVLGTAIRQARHSNGNLAEADRILGRIEGRLKKVARSGATDSIDLQRFGHRPSVVRLADEPADRR